MKYSSPIDKSLLTNQKMRRKSLASSNKVSNLILGVYLTILLSIPFYWFVSGLTMNYTMRFWLGVVNNGEAVIIPSWPGYLTGGLLGGFPIVTGGVTYIIDGANILTNDPYP